MMISPQHVQPDRGDEFIFLTRFERFFFFLIFPNLGYNITLQNTFFVRDGDGRVQVSLGPNEQLIIIVVTPSSGNRFFFIAFGQRPYVNRRRRARDAKIRFISSLSSLP